MLKIFLKKEITIGVSVGIISTLIVMWFILLHITLHQPAIEHTFFLVILSN